MKILVVADVSLKEILGGAERVLHEQTVRLAWKGHEVHVITRRLSSHEAPFECIQGVNEWRYEVDDTNPFTYLLSTITHCRKLYKLITQNISFDLIHFHQPFSALGINLIKETHPIEKIYTCHSLAFEEYATRHAKGNILTTPGYYIQIMFRKWMEKFSLDRSNTIIVLSEYTQRKLADQHKISKDKIMIIPGGVDITHFKPADHKNNLRQYLKISSEMFVLFTVRNLVPRMGLENLIQAMALLEGKIQNLCLIIGGDGQLKFKLLDLIREYDLKNSVQLVGFLSDEQLLMHFQMAEFFILPTIALEGFGLVTVEALSCGTPVLGTPIGGTKEILTRFDASFLFDDTSPEAIARLIEKKYAEYRENPTAYDKLSDKCRKFIEEHYSWEVNVRQTEQLIQQAIQKD